MDRQTIQEMLDSLDMQLAAGKIDLEMYRSLTAKWQARLAELGAGAPPAAAPTTAPAVERVACPECGAPLEDIQAGPGETVRCGFCRATFTLKRAQEKTASASQELRRWLEEMVVESGRSGTVDAASRRFIFGEKLYPALALDYRRSMEPYEEVQQYPMVYFDLLAALPRYRPADHVLVRNPEAIPRVRALNLKVNSHLLGSFAVAEEDRQQLREMDLETTHLVHLANVANQLAQMGAESYASAKENLLALQEKYRSYLPLVEERGQKEYLLITMSRLEAGARIMDVLATIFTPGADFAPQVFIDELEAAQSVLQQAWDQAEVSVFNPLRMTPLRTGLDREQKIVALLRAVLRSYQTATRNRGLVFANYYADLRNLLLAVCSSPTNPDDIMAAVEQIDTIVRARQGETLLYRGGGWDWCDRQVESGRKRGFLGGGETVGRQTLYWHPFWYAVIRYTEAKGAIFVSGVERLAYGAMDATDCGAAPEIILPQTPFYRILSQALEQKRGGDGNEILPPVVPRSTAERAILQEAQRLPNLRNVQVRMEGLLYLPAVAVQYQSSSGPRLAHYSLAPAASPAGASLLPRVTPFFARYT